MSVLDKKYNRRYQEGTSQRFQILIVLSCRSKTSKIKYNQKINIYNNICAVQKNKITIVHGTNRNGTDCNLSKINVIQVK